MKTQTEINAMIDLGEYEEVIKLAYSLGLAINLNIFAAKCTLIDIELIKPDIDTDKYELILKTIKNVSIGVISDATAHPTLLSIYSIENAIGLNPSCKPQVEQYLKEVFE